ncbi:phosphoenolpyruvate--protein phosphotransferase [Chitinasiproducens palmae]|uniref:phosphoenolpyruvate--protein phosphotransferase n=1 Tax=Chitinasiproducens palmae TaxID=1770053 RepID=A0A1H2PKC2_9BURK|nr:phosphoenolpyruvate--protein phosphotransferase [Chitinasiproducens palmae]SDV46748.1 Phosphocarrier protein HPr /phosphoenolpyruvate--protein phosphotransferase /PTS system D-fructose-specific IIA component (F1P-forming), Frc family [Chitinasiproducens palmae]
MSITLDPACVRLNATADDRYGAILMAGRLLVDAGCIAPHYVDSMVARERAATTYLGAGVAIPHGLPAERGAIHRTGIAVLRLSRAVEWAVGRGSARDAVHFGTAVETMFEAARKLERDGPPAADAGNEQAEPVRLIVAIAAASDEHLAVLQQLTRMIGDPERMAEAMAAPDVASIIATMSGAPVGRAPSSDEVAEPCDLAARRVVILDYPNGLHARPASAWAACAKRFAARMRVRHGAVCADPRSVVELLQLGASANAELVISAHGEDAEAALAALTDTIVGLHAEEHRRAVAAHGASARAGGTTGVGCAASHRAGARGAACWTPRDPARSFSGIGVGPGLAIGVIQRVCGPVSAVADVPRGRARDGAALDAALEQTLAELERLALETAERLGPSEGEIFTAQAHFLDDQALLSDAAGGILDGHGAAWSWREAVRRQANLLSALPDPLLAGRAADLQDVGARVLRRLCDESSECSGGSETGSATPFGSMPAAASATVSAEAPAAEAANAWLRSAGPVVVLAQELAPSDAVGLDPATTAGFCTAAGGPSSHTAILARTLGLPAAVACGDAVMTLPDGALVVLDGDAGVLYADVSERDLERARAAQRAVQDATARLARDCMRPAMTRDGRRIEVGVNVTRPDQVAPALAAGADGVGLMRTEFLFLGRDRAPSEDEQFDAYRALVEASGGRRLIIRTLDIGGDKQVPYLDLPHETNPFLGVRGLRLCLRRPDLFLPQLRALYRAARHGPLSIMFPMVSDLDEARRAVQLAGIVRSEVDGPQVPLGIMIETPSAAVLAEAFAGIVDFFSIGTNDLTQYALAIDREHPTLAAQADSLHPAVLRLISLAVDGAQRGGAWVGVCGGLAGEPLGAAILAGLGVDEISMSVGDIAAVKARIRQASLPALQALAQRALRCGDNAAVRALAQDAFEMVRDDEAAPPLRDVAAARRCGGGRGGCADASAGDAAERDRHSKENDCCHGGQHRSGTERAAWCEPAEDRGRHDSDDHPVGDRTGGAACAEGGAHARHLPARAAHVATAPPPTRQEAGPPATALRR